MAVESQGAPGLDYDAWHRTPLILCQALMQSSHTRCDSLQPHPAGVTCSIRKDNDRHLDAYTMFDWLSGADKAEAKGHGPLGRMAERSEERHECTSYKYP